MITFWRTTDKYGAFSNFSPHHIKIGGKIWPTTEHFYQAMKTPDPDLQEDIRKCKTPKEAKELAQTVPLRKDWEEVKFDIMVMAVRAKAEQYTSIKQMLLDTGDEEIGEASPYDYEWGLGKDGTGRNLLGKVLMQLREELRS